MTSTDPTTDLLRAVADAERSTIGQLCRAHRERMEAIGYDARRRPADRVDALRLAIQLAERELELLGAGDVAGEMQVAAGLVEAVDVLSGA